MSGEPRDIPLPVTFVRSMTTPSGVRIHDWRSRTSGRIFEVPEVHVFATGEHLNEGDVGFLRFSAGHLYVVQSEDDPVATTRTPMQPATSTTAPKARQRGAQASTRARDAATREWTRGPPHGSPRTPGATSVALGRLARRFARWLALARQRAAHVRLPRLSGTQWFLSMLGVLLLVIVLRLLVG